MGGRHTGVILGSLERLFTRGTVACLGEDALIERFVNDRDEAAFSALVTRHGPMVLGVCRRILRNEHDVEDAFQATFLVFARRAGTIRNGDLAGPWLYGVAYRVAARARANAARRPVHERALATTGGTADEPSDRGMQRELKAGLDEELARLPESLRSPLVLCYLEGLTHDETARRLGQPVGTVRSRMARGRRLLRGRLARRGFAPATVGLAGELACEARTVVPTALAESTVRAAMTMTSGIASAGMVSASVASLMTGVLTAMLPSKIKLVAPVLVLLGTSALGLAYQASDSSPEQADDDKTPDIKVEKVVSIAPAQAGDWEARLGEIQGTLDRASRSVMTLSEKNQELVGEIRSLRTKLAEAIELRNSSEARSKRREQPTSASPTPPRSPKAKAIREALEKPIDGLGDETPLEDVLKYITEVTIGPDLPKGIPLYVDPVGLQEAEKTMTSPIQLDLVGVPLRVYLSLMLKQIGLIYEVKDDGLLVITNEGSEGTLLEQYAPVPSPLNDMQARAERGELSPDEMKTLLEQLKGIAELRKAQVELDGLPQRKYPRDTLEPNDP